MERRPNPHDLSENFADQLGNDLDLPPPVPKQFPRMARWAMALANARGEKSAAHIVPKPTTTERLKAVGYTPLKFMPLPEAERKKALKRVETLKKQQREGSRKQDDLAPVSRGYTSGQLRLLKKYLSKSGKGFIVVPTAEHEARPASADGSEKD
jgi:hypothetical protein